jgi:hypothetical protein
MPAERHGSKPMEGASESCQPGEVLDVSQGLPADPSGSTEAQPWSICFYSGQELLREA